MGVSCKRIIVEYWLSQPLELAALGRKKDRLRLRIVSHIQRVPMAYFDELFAGLVFSAVLVTVSYSVNRRVLGAMLRVQAYPLILTMSTVFALAVLAECLMNPLYEILVGQKLWEYRALPRHDRNVSQLAVVVWAAYGVHLYFTLQTLERKLPSGGASALWTSAVIGVEAPFVFEVTGNLVFLALTGSYYAYYLPGDIFHLTSVRVVPIYMVCILLGLFVMQLLNKARQNWALPVSIYLAGVGLLALG